MNDQLQPQIGGSGIPQVSDLSENLLPQRPPGFQTRFDRSQKGRRRMRMPKSATLIGQVNTTSPNFWMRFDSYYISTDRNGPEWVLWRKTHDNIGVLNSLAAIAFADKGEEPTHTAATYLLLDTLMKYARVHGEAPFRSVKRPGLLSSQELRALRDKVWRKRTACDWKRSSQVSESEARATTMNHEPIIPLSPEQTPAQNQEPKPALPPRPPGFQAAFEKPKGSGFSRMPRSADYLGQVEWASCPMGTRLDGYYLSTNGRGTHWILWLKYYDDDWGRWNPPVARAFVAKGDIPRDVAAVWLLIEKWRLMAREGLGRFSWVNESGLLSADELCAMRDVAWGAGASPAASASPA